MNKITVKFLADIDFFKSGIPLNCCNLEFDINNDHRLLNLNSLEM